MIRFATLNDAPQLKRLWARSFGDSEAFVQDFLDHFGYETGITAETDGVIAGAAYLIPTDGIRIPGAGTLSCCYLYALAVLPEYRGLGLGKELTEAARRFSKELGYDYTVLKPSDKKLFGYYAKLGFENFTFSDEFKLRRSELTGSNGDIKIFALSPAEYGKLRKEMLRDIVHIAPSDKELEYQARLGKLLGLDFGNQKGCAAVESYGSAVKIKELLVPESEIHEAVSKIASLIPAEKYSVVTPAGRRSSASGMIWPPLKINNSRPFLGLAFD